jgi:hypothetical protein
MTADAQKTVHFLHAPSFVGMQRVTAGSARHGVALRWL